MHLHDAFDIFRRDDSRLAPLHIGENAAQVDDPVTDDDAEAERTPLLLLHRLDDAIADMVIIGRWIGHVPGETLRQPEEDWRE